MESDFSKILTGLPGCEFKESLGQRLGALELLVAINGDERLVRAFSLSRFRTPQEKLVLLNEIKNGELLDNQPYFVKQFNHLYLNNHLLVVYENFKSTQIDRLAPLLDLYNNLPLLMKDMVDAMGLLREKKLVHARISPKMITFINGYFKLCFFSFCDPLGSPPRSPFTLYDAPETHTKGIVLVQSQIYSFGVIFYQLLCGTFPLQNEKPEHLKELYQRRKKLDLVFPKSADTSLCELIQNCLEIDYQARISLRSLKEAIDKLAKTYFQNVIAHRKILIHRLKDTGGKVLRKERSRSFYNKGPDVSFTKKSQFVDSFTQLPRSGSSTKNLRLL